MNGENGLAASLEGFSWLSPNPEEPATVPWVEPTVWGDIPSYATPAPTFGELQTVGPAPSGDTGGFFDSLWKDVGGLVGKTAGSIAAASGSILASAFRSQPSTSGLTFGPGAPMFVGSRERAGYPGVGSVGGGPDGLPGFASVGTTNPLGFLMSPWTILAIMGILLVVLLGRR